MSQPRRSFDRGAIGSGALGNRHDDTDETSDFADVEIGVWDEGKLRPPSEPTGGSPAFGSPVVVNLQRRSADASRLVSGSSNGWLLLPGRQPTDSEQQLKVCILALLFTDLERTFVVRFFLLSFVRCLHFPCLTWLHGHYPASSATTEALSPSGHGSSGLTQTMDAVPSPDRQ